MRKAGEIVTAFFREGFGSDFMDNARSTTGLFSSWKEIVTKIWPRAYGSEQSKEDVPAAAVHSQIYELERGILFVEADHPGWIQILQTKQAELLSAVQKRYPELDIRGIAFRLSRGSNVSPPAPGHSVTVSEKEDFDVCEEKDSRQMNADCQEIPAGSDRSGAVKPDKPRDEEFYKALKGLEESMKKRNSI